MDKELLINGIFISITGYLIVFVALALLYYAFYYLPKILKIKFKKVKNQTQVEEKQEEITGTTVAAISTAIYMFFNVQHDNESYELTIKKISRRYSPWNSKIYAMNNINKIR